MTVTASFSAAGGVLSIFSDNLDNTVTVSRDAAGNILVNGGAVAVVGGVPSVANTALIQAFGLGGNDNLRLDQANGALPRANLFGGADDDTASGGAGNDQVFGQSGNDVLIGGGGFDFLFGGSENDTLTGGDDDDQVFGESGNDLMIWNPGDDTDLFEGGADIDTAQVNGGAGAEVFSITANGTRVRFDRLDPAPFSIDIGTTEKLVLNANGGDDFVSTAGNLAPLIALTIDGGIGNDTILGGNGADLLLGGSGNDVIDGQQGNDTALLGAGDDTFQWDPGDGSDVVEGQDGTDTLLFNGSAGNEIFEASANGGRVLFTRNLGTIVMDLDDVETIKINALGGTDAVTVNDLTGTDVKLVAVDLAGVIGGAAGDGLADTVIVNGSNANNTIQVQGAGASVAVTGLPAQVTIDHTDGATDQLLVNGLGGNDTITATTLPAGVIQLTLDGGAGNDIISGSQGSDTILGGDGNDSVFGDNGNDVAFLGAGDDAFRWAPGDGNDTVEGGDGTDTLVFDGAAINETINIVANGARALFTRDIANVVMDLNDVETIQFNALGGEDKIVVGDLSGTDVTKVELELASALNGAAADGKLDSVTVTATNGADVVTIASVGSQIAVNGLQAQVIIDHADKTDVLVLNALDGDDVINASGLAANKIALQVNGGRGEDIIIGGAGNDTVNGGDGNDTALLGAGNDVFVWNPGDDNDVVEGEAGTDTLLFNGAIIGETINIAADGGRVLFTRDIANVVMDLDDVETIQFNALGGTDKINVGDLTGTDAKLVSIDLAGTIGGTAGDGQVDAVTVTGSNANNTIQVQGAGTSVTVTGLPAQVAIGNAEASDSLLINALGGNDTITATTLPAGVMQLVVDGGAGNDTISGSQGNDVLLGGDGNDSVFGDDGNDIALLGAGDDVFRWAPGDDNDIVEGQDGTDTLVFDGAAINEIINIAANGGRVLFTRDIANVVMDLNDVERIEFNALGGEDKVLVGDLSGTDVTQVEIELASALNGKAADGKLDSVTVTATNGADVVTIASVGSQIVVNGLQAQVIIDHADKTDVLVLNALDGDDVINASGLAANKIALQVNSGRGEDIIIGGAGNDTVNGGDGNDTALLGAGNDVFVWNPGDDNDVVEGEAGTDTLLFNGAIIGETINIAADGGRVLFTRDIANVVMDLNDVETIRFNALGGADKINVGDLTGTDAKLVSIDLAGTIGGTTSDGQVDTVTVTSSNANNTINVTQAGTAITVTGLPAQVTVDHADATDQLVVNGLGGNDTINASGIGSGKIALQLFGGDGNDVIFGSAGGDAIEGGAGNDRLLGNAGSDTITGGAGNDTINGGVGSDTFMYSGPLDGHDIIDGFDGNAVGGQDTLNLDALFDGLSVAEADRAGRVSVNDKGASVDISVDLDGNAANGFEFIVATLNTTDVVSVGQDVVLGT